VGEGEILAGIEARRAARAAKQYAEADRIRNELDAAGVLLEDGKSGTTWKYKE
jgi:cysteinyl-tRNA synthetase